MKKSVLDVKVGDIIAGGSVEAKYITLTTDKEKCVYMLLRSAGGLYRDAYFSLSESVELVA
jgi:hypothetical protein